MPTHGTLQPYDYLSRTIEDNTNTGLNREFSKIAKSIGSIIVMTPQVATVAPRNPPDGCQRLARSPWRPVGGTADVWVYYDQPSATWKTL